MAEGFRDDPLAPEPVARLPSPGRAGVVGGPSAGGQVAVAHAKSVAKGQDKRDKVAARVPEKPKPRASQSAGEVEGGAPRYLITAAATWRSALCWGGIGPAACASGILQSRTSSSSTRYSSSSRAQELFAGEGIHGPASALRQARDRRQRGALRGEARLTGVFNAVCGTLLVGSRTLSRPEVARDG